MRLQVHYTTSYSYSDPPRRIIQLLRVTPLSYAGQTVLDWRIDVDCDARLHENRDGYGNVIHMLYIDRPGRELQVTVSGRVLTEDAAGVIAGLAGDLPPPVFLQSTPLTEPGPGIAQYRAIVGGEGPVLDRLHRLNAAIHEGMGFDTGQTHAGTTACEAATAGHGVCQDFAHIFIAAARTSGIPARYVSGHLLRRDGMVWQEAAHAWVEAWVEDLGWTAFDPTHGISTDDAHIRVAAGLDYRDAAPFAGARNGGGTEALAVEVQVRQVQAQVQN
jgi:transglutaminase-like putative cysteine protease